MPIELEISMPMKVQAKELRIHCKVVDEFTGGIYDQNGEALWEQNDGYVPNFMPGDHFGDYLILNIDLETGVVTNWKKPTAKDIQELIEKDDE